MSAPSSHKHKRGRTNEQARERYHKNKVAFNMSRRIRHSLGGRKGCSWEKYVGYTLQDLKEHLQSKFKDGIS